MKKKKEKQKKKLISKNGLSSSLRISSQKYTFINNNSLTNNNVRDDDDNGIINNLLNNDNTQNNNLLTLTPKSRTSSSSSDSLIMDNILSIDNSFQDNFIKIKQNQNQHRTQYYGDDSEKLKLLQTRSSSNDYNDEFNNDPVNNDNYDVIKCLSFWKTRTNYKQLRFLLYIIFYIIYLIAGGYIFFTIETPGYDKRRGYATTNYNDTKFEEIKKLFLEKYTNVDAYELENLLNEIQKSTEIGIPTYKNLTNDIGWSFGEAFFFAGTTVTTIGYGHTPPISDLGKIFCIIYSIFGIPFTLVLISASVERLLVPSNWLLGMLNSKLGHLYQPFNIRFLHLSIIVSLVGLMFFVIPAFVLKLLEPKWSTIDSFYYVFVSLTTIGFGDFIPDGEMDEYNRTVYKVLITIYLIFGIISLMLVVTIFCSIPQLNMGQLFTENGTGENEKLRLSAGGSRMYSGPSGLYIPQGDDEVRRAVVRIRPRGDDSPSPEDTTPMHARDIRVP